MLKTLWEKEKIACLEQFLHLSQCFQKVVYYGGLIKRLFVGKGLMLDVFRDIYIYVSDVFEVVCCRFVLWLRKRLIHYNSAIVELLLNTMPET